MNNRWKHIAATLATQLCLAVPGMAQGVDGLVQLDVLDGGKSDSGTYLGAIRLTLADGWKTYWRAPGDAGIPPQFDWSASGNVGEVSITWPAPHVFDQNGLRSIGYADQLVLPIEISPRNPAKPVRLRGEVDLGVCKDVCVPGQLTFDHTLNADAGRHPAIAAALAQRPFSAREAGVALGHMPPVSDRRRHADRSADRHAPGWRRGIGRDRARQSGPVGIATRDPQKRRHADRTVRGHQRGGGRICAGPL